MSRCSDEVEKEKKILEEFKAVLCVLTQSRDGGKGAVGFISMASAAFLLLLGYKEITVHETV